MPLAAELADEECEARPSAGEPLASLAYTACVDSSNGTVWDISEHHRFEGTFEFEDLRDAFDYPSDVGEPAQKEWHQPAIHG